jgi:hypothetical protein
MRSIGVEWVNEYHGNDSRWADDVDITFFRRLPRRMDAELLGDCTTSWASPPTRSTPPSGGSISRGGSTGGGTMRKAWRRACKLTEADWPLLSHLRKLGAFHPSMAQSRVSFNEITRVKSADRSSERWSTLANVQCRFSIGPFPVFGPGAKCCGEGPDEGRGSGPLRRPLGLQGYQARVRDSRPRDGARLPSRRSDTSAKARPIPSSPRGERRIGGPS